MPTPRTDNLDRRTHHTGSIVLVPHLFAALTLATIGASL